MTDPGLHAEHNPPFGPDAVQHPDVVADTIEAGGLVRTLPVLVEGDVALEAAAQTANPDRVNEVVESIPFLRATADSVVAETLDHSLLLPEDAYRLGVCVAASTIEMTAQRYSTYGVGPIEDDIIAQARELNETGARAYREQDRPDVWAAAMHFLDQGARERLAEAMVSELQAGVAALSPTEAARAAERLLHRLGEAEGTDAGVEKNPWETNILDRDEPMYSAAAADAMVGSSAFVRRTAHLLVDPNEHASDQPPPEELYDRGVRRALAFIAVGVMRIAGDRPASGAAPDAI